MHFFSFIYIVYTSRIFGYYIDIAEDAEMIEMKEIEIIDEKKEETKQSGYLGDTKSNGMMFT